MLTEQVSLVAEFLALPEMETTGASCLLALVLHSLFCGNLSD